MQTMEPSSSSSSSAECRPPSDGEEAKDDKEEKSRQKADPTSERRDTHDQRKKKKSKKSASSCGSNEIDGCAHYRRRCRIVAPCCGEVCWCRHCHAEKTQHELDRKAIKEVICSKCHKRQPRGRNCISCDVVFGEYFCGICNFWDDEGITKKVFHCDECGICRIGGRDNYFHCKTCGCCYPMEIRDNHKCVVNAMQQDCPICLHDLFQSTTQVTILQCGHTIHQSCLADMRKSFCGLQNLRCPICSMSLDDFGEIWKELDLQVASTPMPKEYSKIMVKIICCDCQKFSEVPFHVIGHKCSECSSYNTRRA